MDLAYMAALPQEEFTERRQKVSHKCSQILPCCYFLKLKNVVITTAIFLSVKTVTFVFNGI